MSTSKSLLNRKTWAGRSVRYDRRVRNAEAAGSNPARSTFTSARPLFESPQTLEVILDLKKNGKAEETIHGYSRRLRHLASGHRGGISPFFIVRKDETLSLVEVEANT